MYIVPVDCRGLQLSCHAAKKPVVQRSVCCSSVDPQPRSPEAVRLLGLSAIPETLINIKVVQINRQRCFGLFSNRKKEVRCVLIYFGRHETEVHHPARILLEDHTGIW